MPSIINTNIPSLVAQRNLNKSESALGTSIQRLSSGLRINSAKDDAAGLAISERFTSQIRGLLQGSRNANDGVSMAQTAEGTLAIMTDNLQRIRELAVQSSNATNTAGDREALQQEVAQSLAELQRLATTSNFNGQVLFDGTLSTATFQVGANASETINIFGSNFKTDRYGNNSFIAASYSLASFNTLNDAATLTVNGYIGTATVAIASATSAQAIATGINARTNNTGVAADAFNEVNVQFTTGSFTLALMGENSTAVNVAFTLSAVTTADDYSAAISAINAQTAVTGITASFDTRPNNGGIKLRNESGANIDINNAGTVAITATMMTISQYAYSAATSLTAGASIGSVLSAPTLTVGSTSGISLMGRVRIDSQQAFSVTETAATSNLGWSANTQSGAAGSSGSFLQKVSSIDLGTFEGAQAAIMIASNALNNINNARSVYGAAQIRLDNVVNSNSIVADNLTASRSRIRDADFAEETAMLTKNQILQQAGIAMLAQANALPNNVLSLLRG